MGRSSMGVRAWEWKGVERHGMGIQLEWAEKVRKRDKEMGYGDFFQHYVVPQGESNWLQLIES